MTPVLKARFLGQPRLTAGLDRFPHLDLAIHRSVHGAFPMLSLDQLIGLCDDIVLCGRGGAGFPFARKLRAVRQSMLARDSRPVVVVNAAEGEPGSAKDKLLIRRSPHLVLDGAIIAARALDAHSVILAVADGEVGAGSLTRAVAERRTAGLIRVITLPDRFISGEAGALVRGLNGEEPIPPGRKTPASDVGVNGLPTLLSNAETFAQLAIASRLGPHAYAAVGLPSEPGTVLLTVGGASGQPGIVEVPTGSRLTDVLALSGSDVGPGVLVGGFHGSWLRAADLPRVIVSRAGLAEVGGTLGAGVVLALGTQTCPLGEVAAVLRYLAGESAGQCGPCRRGLPELARRMIELVDGGGRAAAAKVRSLAADLAGRGACRHPDGTAQFAASAVTVFVSDLDIHMSHGGCGKPVLGVLPVPPAPGTGRSLTVDWTRCDAHGLCAHLLPELISLDANGYPSMVGEEVPEALTQRVRRAVHMCPALALRLTNGAARRERPKVAG